MYNDLKRLGSRLGTPIFIGFPMCSAPLFPWEAGKKYYVKTGALPVAYENAS